MNFLIYLKKLKCQLLDNNKANEEKVANYNSDDIDIVIENNNNLFENEHEIIRNGAIALLESGDVINLEEGIVVFATMIRGLKYRRTEKDENGKVKIILRDHEKTIG